MKKLLCLLMATLTLSAFSLIGCNNAGTNSSSSTNSSSQELSSSESNSSKETSSSQELSSSEESSSSQGSISSQEDYGTLTINDINIVFDQETIINPVFSIPSKEESITYSYEGENVNITNGLLKALIPNTTTVVTATTAHHQTTFNVTVDYASAVLTTTTGGQAKFKLPCPTDTTNYLSLATVEVELYRQNGFTRISSFAFNSSDNSWYNIELNASGDAILYARFNNVEKYHINLFNVNDTGVLQNGKFSYNVAILKEGQASSIFINDKLTCSFSTEEMSGYATLGALEVTAAADRENAGEYKINLTNVYYALDGSEKFTKYKNLRSCQTFAPVTLSHESGAETKYSLGNLAINYTNFLLTSTVTVNTEITNWTRPSAFAFNASDNSWYNIEADGTGNYTLYARFNGVEKYHIYLFNKNDEGIMVDGKVTYTVNLLKIGQETYFFVNDKFVASFSLAEMQGYAKLETLEIIACDNRNNTAYNILYNNAIEDDSTINYNKYKNLIKGTTYTTQTLTESNGNETKFSFGNLNNLYDSFVLQTKVTVDSDSTEWTRTSAFAFNASDNSWYNIETDGSGNYTLYGRFNGVEKYHIHLFNKNDEGIMVDGKVTYTATILKSGQATYFFINDNLVCSFNSTELSGYAQLTTLEISACANRTPSAYTIKLDSTLEYSYSATYGKYSTMLTA